MNGAFAKRVKILRIHHATACIFDQDGWKAAVPHHAFARLEEKLRGLAERAAVPVFKVSRAARGSDRKRDSAACTDTSVTLELPGGTGDLRLLWNGPHGEFEEVVSLWPAVRLAARGATVAVSTQVLSASPSAREVLGAVAAWISAKSAAVVLVVDAATVEGQLLASEVWPQLSGILRAAVVVTPVCPTEGQSLLPHHGGAAAGYCLAKALHSILPSNEGADSSDTPCMALVSTAVWSSTAATLLPVLQEQLTTGRPQSEGGFLLCLPAGVDSGACRFLEQMRDAYDASRPYVHALIGTGAMEADVQGAFSGAYEAMQRLVQIGDSRPSSPALKLLEDSVASPAASRLEGRWRTALFTGTQKTLVPVGRAAQLLAELAKECLGEFWAVGALLPEDAECLVVFDLADAACMTWLAEAEKDGGGELSIHCLALLPDCSAGRLHWDAAAAPLAALAHGDCVELGLALAAPFGTGTAQEIIGLLQALACVNFHTAAFQLRPKPRAGFALPVRWQCCDGKAEPPEGRLETLSGTAAADAGVLASFSLWPTLPAADHRSVAQGFTLSPQLLRPELLPAVACAAAPYEPRAAADDRMITPPVTWHLCTHEGLEASLYQRAVGDFAGRADAEFRFHSAGDGPQRRLWELACELLGEKMDEASNASASPSGASHRNTEREGEAGSSHQPSSRGDRGEEGDAGSSRRPSSRGDRAEEPSSDSYEDDAESDSDRAS